MAPATSASARPHVCSPTWKRQFAEDYARIFGGSGRTGTTASTNCAVAAYRSSMQRSPPVRRRGSGACPDTRRSNRPCATTTSTRFFMPQLHVSVPSLTRSNRRGTGPVCPVVWEGWHREVSPYPDLRRTSVVRSPDWEFPLSCFADLRHGKPPEGKLDGGEGNEGGQGLGKFSKSLARRRFAEPGEGALDHPAARQDDEALHVVAPLDDFHAQQRHLCHRRGNLRDQDLIR